MPLKDAWMSRGVLWTTGAQAFGDHREPMESTQQNGSREEPGSWSLMHRYIPHLSEFPLGGISSLQLPGMHPHPGPENTLSRHIGSEAVGVDG